MGELRGGGIRRRYLKKKVGEKMGQAGPKPDENTDSNRKLREET